jgi:SPP1 gp7 family putative phage head morphogenesis protein
LKGRGNSIHRAALEEPEPAPLSEDARDRRVHRVGDDAAFFRPVHAARVGQIYNPRLQQSKRRSRKGSPNGHGGAHRDPCRGERHFSSSHAGTEVIGSHAAATLNSFKEAGLVGVKVLAEFATAGDAQVCEQYAALEGQIYSMEKAEGLIPVHPNCRCTFIPAVDDLGGVVLR